MKSKRKGESAYEVGYKKPPKRSQFRAGKSGNPRGRPKDRKNEDTILDEILHRKLPMRDRGRIREVPIIEAIFLKFTEAALRGDPKAAAFLLGRYAPPAADEAGDRDLSREDQEILDAFARRMQATPKKGSER
ncbi:MAG: hypothetical protein QOF14_5758 [Hyphomicrobiales bacterium]|jgi:hypothetical protein|nr:hypothetical protein [Hyphomicrobiales bacterium]